MTRKYLILLQITFLLFHSYNAKKNEEEKLNTTYDFIIVGGGTSGCVLASRLAENPKWKILLLEAGESAIQLAKLPALAASWQITPSSWNYYTEPQNDIFKGLNDGRMRWPAGKTLGGSSVINYMIYTRGNQEDFNRWKQLGNPNWSYDDVYPYFLKSEHANMEYVDLAIHNMKGKLNIENAHIGDTTTEFLTNVLNSGYNVTDYNGRDQLGFGTIQATMKSGRRNSVEEAFLIPRKPNLDIITSAHVNRITFDKNNKTKGVKFIQNGDKFRVLTSKEVIISAGTFNTPKLLMLSGIGPKNHLDELEIPLVKHSPHVGQNLRDHVGYMGLNFISNSNRTQLNLIKDYFLYMPYWLLSGKGLLSTAAGFEAIGFVKLPQSPSNQIYPDVELLFHNSPVYSMVKNVANMQAHVYNKLYNHTDIKWSIYPIILHPKSAGYLKLRSKNPQDAPLLYPNYFSNYNDIKTMITAIKLVLNLVQGKEFKEMGVKLNPNSVPGCEKFKFNELSYWECAIRTLTITGYDQFGTCQMGPDGNGVVDDKFKVHRIDKLRIVDASVIPVTISGHLEATAVMLAERAADFIKDEYKNQ